MIPQAVRPAPVAKQRITTNVSQIGPDPGATSEHLQKDNSQKEKVQPDISVKKEVKQPTTLIKLPTYPYVQKTISLEKPRTVPPVTLKLASPTAISLSPASQSAKIFVKSYVVKAAPTVPGHAANVQIVKRDLTSGTISKIELPVAPKVIPLIEKTPAKDSTNNVSFHIRPHDTLLTIIFF